MCCTSPLASGALLQRHFVVVHDSVVCFWPPPTPLLSIAPLRDCWFAAGALDPRESSLQQRALLSLKIGFSFARYVSFTCSAEMSVSLVIVACFAVSFALRSAAIARDASFLHCTRASPRFKCCAQSFFRVRPSLSAFAFAAVFLFDLASCLVVRLNHVRKDRPVFMSGGAFMLSLFWHRFVGCSRLFIVSLLFALHWDSLVDWVF